ncbi:class I SAM-dependent methyltransferase [Methylotenera mobilis]|uniref:Methyltransferase type 12 n=1 Tax=Methylotenera mobilis (strain JLW8 / ATCC BAA-1282 / DSM 17540) TaxID=583345 RepID=C6WVJ2_METML|nr:class I SAM-dependent methyltransferase [Methylotenera mobilis]ACT47941.1 Methyltransferase type 12 [Methylotenera mobilis JLW8]
MFKRPEQNYEVSDQVVDGILSDLAHPLSCIAGLLTNGAHVLDIGAGSGVLGRVLSRAGLNVEIDGIEPNAFAANLARKYYRSVYTGFAEEFYEQISNAQYDFVILADVIEHMPNPQEVLSELLMCLSPKTKLIVSVPNVAFGGIRLALLNGNFDYVDSGLLEHTHLRFFTKNTLKELFSLIGLEVDRAISLERSFYRTEFSRSKMSASFITMLKLAFSSDARAYQYLFVLNKCDGKVSNSSRVPQEHKGVNGITIMQDYIFGSSQLMPLLHRAYRQLRKLNA